ncbi:MAG: hypothetical protein WCS84_04830 [Nocardioides sp.]|jgi:hypothetical protein
MTDTLHRDPRSPSRSRRELWPELALAWASLVLFAVAVAMTVRATEYAWDVEADFALAPGADQSLYGLAYFVYAVVLAPAVVAHLVSVVLATYRTARAAPARGAGWVAAWVAYVLGVVSVAAVCALGVEFVLGLDGAPENLRDRALFFHAAPALVVSMAGLVPLLWAGRGARTR